MQRVETWTDSKLVIGFQKMLAGYKNYLNLLFTRRLQAKIIGFFERNKSVVLSRVQGLFPFYAQAWCGLLLMIDFINARLTFPVCADSYRTAVVSWSRDIKPWSYQIETLKRKSQI